MANLVDRIASQEDNSVEKIAVHSFSSALWFLKKGEITVAQIKTAFNMDTSAQSQFDEMITFFQGLSADDKSEFRDRLESAGILLETGLINKTKFKSLLGVS